MISLRRESIGAAACVLGGGVLWGFIGVFSSLLSDRGLSSMQLTVCRGVVTVLFLFLLILVTGPRQLFLRARDVLLFSGMGICSVTLFNFLYLEAIRRLDSLAMASVLLYTSPMFVAVLSAAIFREKFRAANAAAILLSFGGCVCVAGFGRRLPPSWGFYSAWGRDSATAVQYIRKAGATAVSAADGGFLYLSVRYGLQPAAHGFKGAGPLSAAVGYRVFNRPVRCRLQRAALHPVYTWAGADAIQPRVYSGDSRTVRCHGRGCIPFSSKADAGYAVGRGAGCVSDLASAYPLPSQAAVKGADADIKAARRSLQYEERLAVHAHVGNVA